MVLALHSRFPRRGSAGPPDTPSRQTNRESADVCEEELTECRRRRHRHAIGTAGVTYGRPRGVRGMDRCEGMIAAPGWPFSSDAKCQRNVLIKVPSERNLLALGERTRWMYRSMTNIAESFDRSRHRGIVSPGVARRRCPTKRSQSHLGLMDSSDKSRRLTRSDSREIERPVFDCFRGD